MRAGIWVFYITTFVLIGYNVFFFNRQVCTRDNICEINKLVVERFYVRFEF